MIQKENKNQEQEKTLKNINMLFNGRNNVINFIEGYSSMILEAKRKAAEELNEQEGAGLKILGLKQMLQRLLIALAQVKAGNNSENLLNKIRQIVYSLYRSKKITKKVYNKINQYNEIAFSGAALSKMASEYKNGYYIYELQKQ